RAIGDSSELVAERVFCAGEDLLLVLQHTIHTLLQRKLVVSIAVAPVDGQPRSSFLVVDLDGVSKLQQPLSQVAPLRVEEQRNGVGTPSEVELVREEDFVLFLEHLGHHQYFTELETETLELGVGRMNVG